MERPVDHLIIIIATMGLVLVAPAAIAGGNRGMGYEEALQTKYEARERAARARELSAARERRERYERGWIRRWTRAYGPRVGRWADDAIRVGWPEHALPVLGRIIHAESSGLPRARNPWSDCRGLLQLHPCHWQGRFDPYDAHRNLAYGLKLWRGSGWRPWVTY